MQYLESGFKWWQNYTDNSEESIKWVYLFNLTNDIYTLILVYLIISVLSSSTISLLDNRLMSSSSLETFLIHCNFASGCRDWRWFLGTSYGNDSTTNGDYAAVLQAIEFMKNDPPEPFMIFMPGSLHWIYFFTRKLELVIFLCNKGKK